MSNKITTENDNSKEQKKPEEFTEKQKHIADVCSQRLASGFHCSEAIVKVFNEEYGLNYSPETIKMATGLAGGVGGAKCLCGAVNAGALVLSSIYGRDELGKDDKVAFASIKELHDSFKEKYKTTCCVALTNKIEWGKPSHLEQCSKYVHWTALNLSRILEKYDSNLVG